MRTTEEGEIEVPARTSGASGDPECCLAQERIERFLGGSQPASEDRALHAHLSRCARCNDEYRSALVELSRARRERLDPAPSTALEWAGATGERDRKRANLLRVLIPAVIVVAIVVQLGPSAPIGEVVALEGACLVGATALNVGQAAKEVEAGQSLATDASSIARLETKSGNSLLLAPSTRVFVQDADPAQYLVTTGEVTVDGSCAVTTPFGAVELHDGVAHVTVGKGVLEVESHGGKVTVLDARGEHALAPGERMRLESGETAGL